MATYLILIILVLSIIFAIRSLKSSKGCGHDCSHCSQSCSALQQDLADLLEESKRNTKKSP